MKSTSLWSIPRFQLKSKKVSVCITTNNLCFYTNSLNNTEICSWRSLFSPLSFAYWINKAHTEVRPPVCFSSPIPLESKQSCLILGHHLNPTSPSWLILHTLLLLLLLPTPPPLYLHFPPTDSATTIRAWDLRSMVLWALLLKIEVLGVLEWWGFGGFGSKWWNGVSPVEFLEALIGFSCGVWTTQICESCSQLRIGGCTLLQMSLNSSFFSSEKHLSEIFYSLLPCWYFQIFHFSL